MSEIPDLASQIDRQLPARLVALLHQAGEVAASHGESLYLVGGTVRDLLLGKANLDLDLVVESDAIKLARQLAGITSGKVMVHSRFGTAKLRWNGWSVDVATARSETYDRPGALPRVKPGSLEKDLLRRDFTINAMAVELAPGKYGQLIDPHGGRDDLDLKLIRILHGGSFIDDATRIWRSLRYEQRLDFHLEPKTLELLKRDIPLLATISGDRIRHELELALKEDLPEKIITRADKLGVLSKLHPGLKGDGWLTEKFEQARFSNSPLSALYMALLAYRLNNEENEELISSLRLPKSLARSLRDTASIKSRLGSLADPGLAPSAVYSLLHGHSATALIANLLASESSVARQHIQTYLSKLRYVRPTLTGDDLRGMGIAPGPRMKEILQRLQEARLDAKVTTRKGEEDLVVEWGEETIE